MRRSTTLSKVSQEILQSRRATARNRALRSTRTLACLVLWAFLSAFTAKANAELSAGQGLGFAYDPKQEITLIGTVKGFASPTPRSRAGLHLLISSGGQIVDTHLGPYISTSDQQALESGELVQIVGVNERVRGTNVLLARQLIFHGHLVTVRNERGFLIRNIVSHRTLHTGGTR